MSDNPPGRPGDETPPPPSDPWGPDGSGGRPAYGQPGPDVPPPYPPPYPPPTGPQAHPGISPYGAANPYPGASFPPGLYAGPDDPLVSSNFGGWWGRSFALLGRTWRQLTLVQLIWVPVLLILGVGGALLFPSGSRGNVDASDLAMSELFGALALTLFGTGLLLVVGFVVQLGTLHVLVQSAVGRPVSVGQACLAGLRRSAAMLGWGVLALLLVLVGLVFCLLPGIYAAVVLYILPAVILLERGTGIGRCFRLFHADFGAALGRVATVIAVTVAFGLLDTVVSGVLTGGASFAAEQTTSVAVVSAVVSAIFSAISGVVVAPMLLTAYADMRARHEPFSTAYLVSEVQPAPQQY